LCRLVPEYDYLVPQAVDGIQNKITTNKPDVIPQEDLNSNQGDARPMAQLDPPKVRKDFSESFLWQDVEISKLERARQNKNRGREVINVKVPESITSYIISGVSMNNRFGLALPSSLPSLTVFQPFFIQFTFPFSIKRGEKLKLDIFIFNFLSSAQMVTVSIDKNDAEFSLQNPSGNGWTSNKWKLFSI
jgi:CD109 antigen